MDISKLAPAEAIEAVSAMETVEQLRDAATSINMKFSGNTGETTLRKNLNDLLNEALKAESTNVEPDRKEVPDFSKEGDDSEVIQKAPLPNKSKAPSIQELLDMDPNTIEDQQLLRQVVRAKAFRLQRVRITNLDPADSQLPGALLTVLNKYTGKISRFVSFGDENDAGTHVETALLNSIRNQKFALRKERKGGQFGVKQYDTRMINKYNIEYLPMLTKAELDELAAHQRASHAIDN